MSHPRGSQIHNDCRFYHVITQHIQNTVQHNSMTRCMPTRLRTKMEKMDEDFFCVQLWVGGDFGSTLLYFEP